MSELLLPSRRWERVDMRRDDGRVQKASDRALYNMSDVLKGSMYRGEH